MSLDTR